VVIELPAASVLQNLGVSGLLRSPACAWASSRGDQVVRTVAAAVPGAPYNWVKPTFGWPGT